MVITLAFAVGTGYQHTTFGLYVTAFVLSAIVISLLRSSYEVVTADIWRVAGARRRAVLVGEGERLVALRRALGLGRGGIDYEFVGVLSSNGDATGLPVLGGVTDLPRVLEEHSLDELIVSGIDLGEDELLDLVEEAHRAGVKVRIAPTTAGAAAPARRVRRRPGRAALRAAPAGLRRPRLGGEARVRRRRQRAADPDRAAGVGDHRARR